MGEFWTSTFVIVCALGMVVMPVIAIAYGTHQLRQDRRRQEMLTRLADDMRAVAKRDSSADPG